MAKDKPKKIDIKNAAGTTQSIAVNATATVYSEVITLDKADSFGLFWKAASGGTVKLDLEYEVSYDGTNFCSPENMPLIDNDLGDENLHANQIPIVKAPFLRFKITGVAGNAATTTLAIWFIL